MACVCIGGDLEAFRSDSRNTLANFCSDRRHSADGQTGSETLGAYSGPGHVKHVGGDKA